MLEYYGKQGKMNDRPCPDHTWGYAIVKPDGTLDMDNIWIAPEKDWHIIDGKIYCPICAPYNRSRGAYKPVKGVTHDYSHLPPIKL